LSREGDKLHWKELVIIRNNERSEGCHIILLQKRRITKKRFFGEGAIGLG
jgi:hypothetical protein